MHRDKLPYTSAPGGTMWSHVRAGSGQELTSHRSFIQWWEALSATSAGVNTSVKRTGLKDINWVKAICQTQRGWWGDGDMWTARPWPFKKLHVFATWCVNIKKRMMLLCKNTLKWAVVCRSLLNASHASLRPLNDCCSLKCTEDFHAERRSLE